jgi:hypothetical protein
MTNKCEIANNTQVSQEILEVDGNIGIEQNQSKSKSMMILDRYEVM